MCIVFVMLYEKFMNLSGATSNTVLGHMRVTGHRVDKLAVGEGLLGESTVWKQRKQPTTPARQRHQTGWPSHMWQALHFPGPGPLAAQDPWVRDTFGRGPSFQEVLLGEDLSLPTVGGFQARPPCIH